MKVGPKSLCNKLSIKCFGWGDNWNHGGRFKSSYSTSYNQVPSMNQTLKDHKPHPQVVTRPVCRAKASQSPNGPLADLTCELLDPFVREADREDRTEVISTEELCHEIENTNERIRRAGLRTGSFQQNGKLTVGSMDVDKFYPNMDIDQTAEEAKLEIIESSVEVKGVNTEEVALYLACSMSQEEIDQEGLTDVVHRRRSNKGSRPGLTCKAITGGPKIRGEDKSWLPPQKEPTSQQRKHMLGCLVKCTVKLVMKNHFYSFNNKIRKQKKGGAIGNLLTEKLAKLLMKRFDRKFKALFKKLKIEIELYRRFVDDITAALKALDAGGRFNEDEMRMEKNHELEKSDGRQAEDTRTFEELRKIANTVYKSVQFTTDTPSIHQEETCPVLDLQLQNQVPATM